MSYFVKDYKSNNTNKYFVTDIHYLQKNCTIHFYKVSDEDFSI